MSGKVAEKRFRSDSPALKENHHAGSWAVLIGIDEYPKKGPGIGPLNCAVNDALSMRELLLDLGFPPNQIYLLSNQAATKREIEGVIVDELRSKVGPEDQVLVFFAGHGTTQSLNTGETQEKEGYLLPVDCDPMRLYASSISMGRLREMGQRVGARHFLYLVEACYSGLAIYKTRSITKPGLIDELISKESVQILTAGREGDQAIEVGQHGLFTRVLLDALRGAADLRDWGWIPLDHLAHYVSSRVYAESDKRMYPQHGNLSGSGQFVFAFPKEDRGETRSLPPATAVSRLLTARSGRSDSSVPVVIQQRVSPKLRRLPLKGTLRIRSEAEGVLMLDGKRLAETIHPTEVVEVSDLLAGWHRVSVRGGGETISKTVMVPGNGETEIVLEKPLPRQIIHEGDGAPMVLVPAGRFRMGSPQSDWDAKPHESPQHSVHLDAYYIDKYPVTNGQYAKFLRETRHRKPRYWNDPRVNGPHQPVIGVSWEDASLYCRWAGKRLCTEAEWEKAGRGPENWKYPWGNQWDPAKLIWRKNSRGRTHPVVRSYATHESPYGAVDLAGHVEEWCRDSYGLAYYRNSPEDNPQGPERGVWRVLRGGAWFMGDPRLFRAASRNCAPAGTGHSQFGFRCAKSAT